MNLSDFLIPSGACAASSGASTREGSPARASLGPLDHRKLTPLRPGGLGFLGLLAAHPDDVPSPSSAAHSSEKRSPTHRRLGGASSPASSDRSPGDAGPEAATPANALLLPSSEPSPATVELPAAAGSFVTPPVRQLSLGSSAGLHSGSGGGGWGAATPASLQHHQHEVEVLEAKLLAAEEGRWVLERRLAEQRGEAEREREALRAQCEERLGALRREVEAAAAGAVDASGVLGQRLLSGRCPLPLGKALLQAVEEADGC